MIRRWEPGRRPPGAATQTDRVAWAGAIEAVVMMSRDVDVQTARALGLIARQIRGEDPQEVGADGL